MEKKHISKENLTGKEVKINQLGWLQMFSSGKARHKTQETQKTQAGLARAGFHLKHSRKKVGT